MGTIEVVGEIVVDLVEGAGGLLRPVPGGSPANVALAAARLGTPVQLRARIGADALAQRCRAHLASNGVGLERVVAAPQPATLALATIGPDGSAHYDFWVSGTSDWQWTEAELADVPLSGTVAVHTGSLASWTPPGRSVLLDTARRLRAADGVTVSYDPNVRASLMGDPVRARELVEAYVAASHIVKASDEDVAWLYPDLPVDAVMRRWTSIGAVLTVLTRGGAGATGWLSDGRRCDVDAPPVGVVDTVGAGDTFTGALLHALEHRGMLGDHPTRRLSGTSDDDLCAVLGWAVTAAAVTCSREGCDPPVPDDVMALRRAG